jgi:hypothetical protein
MQELRRALLFSLHGWFGQSSVSRLQKCSWLVNSAAPGCADARNVTDPVDFPDDVRHCDLWLVGVSGWRVARSPQICYISFKCQMPKLSVIE